MKNMMKTETACIVENVLKKYDITPTSVEAEMVTQDDICSRYLVDVKIDKPENIHDVTTSYKIMNEIENRLWDAGHDNPELTILNANY